MDNVTYDTIFTVGQEIHEGWNYVDFSEGQEPKYQYYRFYGSSARSCLIGEIGLKGIEVIDSTATTYNQCAIQLNLNGESSPIAVTGTVSYQAPLTPLLTSISPRWGKV